MADFAGIQFRMLNMRKGPAVQGPRAQMDRVLYKQRMQAVIAAIPKLEVHDGAVRGLLLESLLSHTPAVTGDVAASDHGCEERAHSDRIHSHAFASSSTQASLSAATHVIRGVELASGERVMCRAVVVTTGTFLRGVVHVGSQQRAAGRIAGCEMAWKSSASGTQTADATTLADADVFAACASNGLSTMFYDLGFRVCAHH